MCDVYCQEERSGEFTGNHEVGNKSLQYISNPKDEFKVFIKEKLDHTPKNNYGRHTVPTTS